MAFDIFPSARIDLTACIRNLGVQPDVSQVAERYLRAPVTKCLVCPSSPNLHVHSRLNAYVFDSDGVHTAETTILRCPGKIALVLSLNCLATTPRMMYAATTRWKWAVIRKPSTRGCTLKPSRDSVSHFNLVNWYNRTYVDNCNIPQFASDQAFTPAMSQPMCSDGLDLISLLNHADRRGTQLMVSASGTDHLRFEDAMAAHLELLAVEGTRDRDHYCSRCVRIQSAGIDSDTGEEILLDRILSWKFASIRLLRGLCEYKCLKQLLYNPRPFTSPWNLPWLTWHNRTSQIWVRAVGPPHTTAALIARRGRGIINVPNTNKLPHGTLIWTWHCCVHVGVPNPDLALASTSQSAPTYPKFTKMPFPAVMTAIISCPEIATRVEPTQTGIGLHSSSTHLALKGDDQHGHAVAPLKALGFVMPSEALQRARTYSIIGPFGHDDISGESTIEYALDPKTTVVTNPPDDPRHLAGKATLNGLGVVLDFYLEDVDDLTGWELTINAKHDWYDPINEVMKEFIITYHFGLMTPPDYELGRVVAGARIWFHGTVLRKDPVSGRFIFKVRNFEFTE
ncbi:uncharacterized protein MELLADRAFT_112858 [Melampsora larici-populina 98AG31]|uniref:Uncharacterized protein n=1 Tax=Melampsora larici-populina (strain 98AG31 / pathotype 3-4-7) TaxID=747676 RepID=F4S7X3_MELLP|nr:uncharacterized protein MELLADRAFT_112858 [Melampsora larici-populina 98AG31]EGF99288.1 hypothetical protein MELLADRAFT_112858 [Melampsora larici-populina 98AG31]